MLLGLSALSIFITKTGAVPTKISALGIEFGNADQQAFLWLLVAVVGYFTATFIAYALSDLVAWRKEIVHDDVEGLRGFWYDQYSEADNPIDAAIENDAQANFRKNMLWFSLAKPVSMFRALFEFLLPLVVGVFTICMVSARAYV